MSERNNQLPQPTVVLRALVFALPASSVKKWLLRKVGYAVHPTATVRSSLVWKVDQFEIGPGATFGRYNLVKNVRKVSLGRQASIGRMNLISAHPVYKRLYAEGAALTLGDHAVITSRHSIDCSGAVTLGEYAGIFGHRSTALSHSIDLRRDAQAAAPITIGAKCFVGTNCLLLGGAELPERSVLAAGSTLVRAKGEQTPGLWAGIPARRVADVDGQWFDRTETHTMRVWVPQEDNIVEKAF